VQWVGGFCGFCGCALALVSRSLNAMEGSGRLFRYGYGGVLGSTWAFGAGFGLLCGFLWVSLVLSCLRVSGTVTSFLTGASLVQLQCGSLILSSYVCSGVTWCCGLARGFM